MTSKYATPSTSTEEAIDRWIEELRPPEIAVPTIRGKFVRLKMTVEEIDFDRISKLARLSS